MTVAPGLASRLSLVDALVALRAARRDDDVVITTMGSAREWMKLGPPHPLDIVFVPSSMGHGTSLGLGLALARPDHRVIVCSGDGSLLMNLGSLVTITAQAPPNLIVLVFDNAVYEVTGAQPTPAAAAARVSAPRVDFAAVARACGFPSVYRYTDAERWQADVPGVLDAAGPVFVTLDVEPVPDGTAPHSPGPAVQRARRFMDALAQES